MPVPHETDPERGLTTAQLKSEIDGGREGDKVGGFDPGAAPLGTDAEAGGTPPSPELVRRAALEERSLTHKASSARENAAAPGKAPDGTGRPWLGAPGWAVLGLLLGLLLVWILWGRALL